MGIISKMLERWNNYRARKYTHGVRLHIYKIADLRARLQFSLPISGKDEMLDHSIDDAWKFFIFGGDIEESLSAKAAEIYRWLCSDTDAQNDRALYLRAVHFERTATNESFAHPSAHRYWDLYQKKLVPIDVSMLRKKYGALVKRFYAERLALVVQLIDLELKDFAPIAPIPSAFFVISGYVYTSIVYGYFGIDASQFFTLSDYLAGSINQIWSALSAIAAYLIALMFMYQLGIEFDTKFFFKKLRQSPLPDFLLLTAIFVVLAGAFYFFYVREWDAFWYCAPLLLVFLRPLVWRAVSQIFKNDFRITIIVMLVLLFAAGIVSQSVRKIVYIKSDHEQTAFSVETSEKTFTDENFVFLGGNQRYIFLLKKGADAEIIPLEKIKRMNMFDSTTWRVPFIR
ncbi:MAG: hypothetical protein MPL62_07880 [Alphaproteobacteria bacterium]|nr:hypothetical protein [Alphaproteobacteria bacterium]